MAHVTQKQALRRYVRVFTPMMVFYLLGMIGGTFVVKQFDDPPLWLSLTGAATAILPLCIFLFAWVRYAWEADEFQRISMFKGFAVAGGLTVTLLFSVGILQIFELVGHFDDFWYGVVFLVVQGVATQRFGGKCLP